MQKQIQEQQSPLWTSLDPVAVSGKSESLVQHTQQKRERLTALAIVCNVIILVAGETVGTLGLGLIGAYFL